MLHPPKSDIKSFGRRCGIDVSLREAGLNKFGSAVRHRNFFGLCSGVNYPAEPTTRNNRT